MSPSEIEPETESTEAVGTAKKKFTPRQLGILAVLSLAQFCLSASISLQGPFFPREAEKKGANATVYGFIFGSFELASFVASPLYGKLVVWTLPKYLIISGLFIDGCCSILFGFLDLCPPGGIFIGLAFVCRIIEGLAAAAVTTASYTAIAAEFPQRVSTTFSIMETFFGVGLIAGPTLGGVLYQVQGFPLPFQLIGSLLILAAIGNCALLPKTQATPKNSGELINFLSDPGVILDAFCVITGLAFVGLLSVSLEPQLRQFDLSPPVVGLIFVITGLIYCVSTPLWGTLCDKGVNPKVLCFGGSIFQCVSLLILGPAPFIQVEPRLWLVIISLVIGGFGIAAKIVTAFIDCLQGSIERGFPDDITTHGMVSALFTSSISSGAFLGPSLGGILWDNVGFQMSTMVYLALELVFLLLLLLYSLWKTCRSKKKKSVDETTHLLTTST